MKKIIVNDMTCMHCFQTIQRNLIKAGINADINLAKKVITVKENDFEQAIAIIKASGYTPEA